MTHYGLDDPGIESRWGARFSALIQNGLGPHPASCTTGTTSFQIPLTLYRRGTNHVYI